MRWQLILWWHERAACAGETWYQCQLSETALLITCTGLSIKSLSGFIKSMFASLFFGCFFPAAPELQLPFASERICEDDDDEWQGLLHLAPISELPSFPLSICYRKKGWHMPIIFLSLPLHSTPPPPTPLSADTHACCHQCRSQAPSLSLSVFFSHFFFWLSPITRITHHPSPKWQKQ